MINRFCFKALDRSLRDVIGRADGSSSNAPFDGNVVVCGGNFRQIIVPVITKGTKGSSQDIVHASLRSSESIWNSCQVLKLTKNMRLQVHIPKIYIFKRLHYSTFYLK